MNRTICLTIAFLWIAVASCFSEDYASANKKSDELVQRLREESDIPGISVAISKGDDLVYESSFGYSDIEHTLPVTNDTKYRIGSICKLLTAAATVKLIESGTIHSGDSVSRYLDELPEAYRNITLAQLAGHMSGIRHYTREEIYSTNSHEYASLKEALQKFIGDTLLFTPGTSSKYSSYGYVLLGAVLEKVTKGSFNHLISETVLQPADLRDIEPEVHDSAIQDLSTFYYRSRKSDGFTIAKAENYSYKWPAGGYVATASDLALFGSALLAGKIVDTSYLSLLFSPQRLNNGKEISYGYGFRIGTDWKGRKVVCHGGESEGARAFVLIYPNERLTVVLLANVFGAPLFEGEAETIAGYYLGDYAKPDHPVPNGHYTFLGLKEKQPIEGHIEIHDNSGSIIGFNKDTIPIVEIVLDNSKLRLLGATRNGLINIWLTSENGAYAGQWGYDKPQYEFKMSAETSGQ